MKDVTITPRFELKQKVLIAPINVTGKVVAYYYSTELEYKVRYFDNGDPREAYFYEDELQAVK